ncbi:MAG: hypothetical protein AMJ68_00025 [Acidithiobacillales bacterium SG8_45]|nr:MAG: hypothetical protein AMJ68_00025 [Acidithiobacillales bacterium SG8_45]
MDFDRFFPRRHGPPTSIDGWARQFKARKAQIGQQSPPRMGLDPPRAAFTIFSLKMCRNPQHGQAATRSRTPKSFTGSSVDIARFPAVVRGSDSEYRHGLELT